MANVTHEELFRKVLLLLVAALLSPSAAASVCQPINTSGYHAFNASSCVNGGINITANHTVIVVNGTCAPRFTLHGASITNVTIRFTGLRNGTVALEGGGPLVSVDARMVSLSEFHVHVSNVSNLTVVNTPLVVLPGELAEYRNVSFTFEAIDSIAYVRNVTDGSSVFQPVLLFISNIAVSMYEDGTVPLTAANALSMYVDGMQSGRRASNVSIVVRDVFVYAAY